jgi:signal recognition particle receptor subunit beta
VPHIDKRSGDIVVRIVYDGAPEAGKTTNVTALQGSIPLQRRGALASPDSTGRRTEFFDWLDFTGGFVDGRRLRCQLVSVPGQSQLLHRRKYLLETADAVVFVADSSPAALETNRANLETLHKVMGRLAPKQPVGVVLQANKQDLPQALGPADLHSALGAPASTQTIAAAASSGRGVMETFVLATRMATDRVRALVLEGELETLQEKDASASTLHAAMVKEEDRAPAVRSPAPAAATPGPAAAPPIHSRPNDARAANAFRPFRPESLLAGHVWPSVRGRAVISSAVGDGTFTVPDRAQDWGPASPIEIRLTGGWILHSSARWSFDGEPAARIALITMVRRSTAWPQVLPEGRTFFVGGDGGHRLWMLTPALPSIADEVLGALEACDAKALASAFDAARQATRVLRQFEHAGSEQGCSAVAWLDGRAVFLAPEATPEAGMPTSPEAHALQIATAHAGADEARCGCLARALEDQSKI